MMRGLRKYVIIKNMSISRRDFLKLAALGLGGTGLAYASSQVPEFVKKMGFSPDKLVDGSLLTESDLGIVKDKLDSFGEIVNYEDKDEWAKSVEYTCSVVARINGLRQGSNNGGSPDKLPNRLIENDYKSLNSMVWLVLKLEDQYKYTPDEFRSAIGLESIPQTVLEKALPTVESPWLFSSISQIHDDPGGWNNIKYLLRDPSFLGYYATEFMPWYISEEGRQRALEDFGKTIGAVDTIINGDQLTEDETKTFFEYLKSLRLSRVAQRIGIYIDSGLGGGHKNGHIQLGILEADARRPFEGDKKWEAFLLHEVAHTIWDLVKLVENPDDRSAIRLIMQKMIRSFWPTRDLDTFLNPQGKFNSIDIDNDGYEDNVLNEATITAYSTGYFLSDLNYSGSDLVRSCIQTPKLTELRFDSEIEIDSLSPLEKRIVKRAKEIVLLLKKTERKVSQASIQGTERVDDKRALLSAGIPLAIQDLLQQNSGEFITLVMQSNPNYNEATINLLIKSYFADLENGLEFTSGEELFADIFQCAFRKDNLQVVNEMPDNRLDEMRTNIDFIMDTLIRNKLAIQRSSPTTT